MNFDLLEKNIRSLIAQNKLDDAIEMLTDFFKDDAEIDEITIQTANYNAILDRQLHGVADYKEVDLALNKLRLNILHLIKSKKEYTKFKKSTFDDNKFGEEKTDDLIKVFFSVASPHNNDQQNYINKLIEYFRKNGIKLETLKEWNDNDPLIPILEDLKKSYGCLVLALERFYVNNGLEKRGSEQEGKITDTSLVSPWLQIETALARSLDLPLIILKDQSLKNEGLIHNDKQEWGIVRIDQRNIGEIEEYPVKNFILNWINQVKNYYKTTTV